MSHIFGFEHSFGGIVNQVLGGVTGVGNPFPPLPSTFGAFPVPTVNPGFNAPVVATGTTATEVIIDNATGACISVKEKKHRRRRRRLATDSDIADLSALKAVLGPKALNQWIATRGRR